MFSGEGCLIGTHTPSVRGAPDPNVMELRWDSNPRAKRANKKEWVR
jgi:hypothetical protein